MPGRILELPELRNVPLREVEPGNWLMAKEVPGPMISEIRIRLAAAWEVFRGRAVAVRWYVVFAMLTISLSACEAESKSKNTKTVELISQMSWIEANDGWIYFPDDARGADCWIVVGATEGIQCRLRGAK